MVNGYAGYTVSERKFRKWTQINANNCVCHSECPLCHSEHSEESRGGKDEILRFALNDKRLDADMNIPPSPPSRGKAKRSVGKTGNPLGGGLKA